MFEVNNVGDMGCTEDMTYFYETRRSRVSIITLLTTILYCKFIVDSIKHSFGVWVYTESQRHRNKFEVPRYIQT
jgi:hypothetical protein